MPKQIYNEGRVVGLSAYEMYLRHQLSEYPDMEAVTEREWLSSTLGHGASLILNIPSGTKAGIFEKTLPDNSILCAASTITACLFNGEVELDNKQHTWATKVTSYGSLISNTTQSHPAVDSSSIPSGNIPDDYNNRIVEYMKIVDGVVCQPGKWEQSESNPYMDLKEPDLNKLGFIRLRISKTLAHSVNILLTGWAHKPIVAGSTKIEEGCVNLIHPWNGDFLGPERFPWSAKITFIVPNEAMYVLNEHKYERKFEIDSAAKSVTAEPVIDYDSVAATTYYNSIGADSRIPINVTDYNVQGNGVATLSVYQRSDKTVTTQSGRNITGRHYPPVLYGAKIVAKGDQNLVPIDTAAPGTVKVFENKEDAVSYPKVLPNTYAMWHDKANKQVYFIEGDNVISMGAQVSTINRGTSNYPAYTSVTKAGSSQIKSISLIDTKGADLDLAGSKGIESLVESSQTKVDGDYRYLNWSILLAALGNNHKIDLIGDQLRELRRFLPDLRTQPNGRLIVSNPSGPSLINGPVTLGGDLDDVNVSCGCGINNGARIDKGKSQSYNVVTTDKEFNVNKPIISGSNYVGFRQSDGKILRLYISNSAPKGSESDPIPTGSIGIGW